MRKRRGFRLGRKVVKLWRWFMKPKLKLMSRIGYYERLHPQEDHHARTSTAITKIRSWGRSLSQKLRSAQLLHPLGYERLGEPEPELVPVPVPKGHLAVYVGQKDDDPHRYLVPIIYFNHPLFGELLREAEEEFGFHRPGGITIPCRASEFESVQMKIAAGERCRKVIRKRRPLLLAAMDKRRRKRKNKEERRGKDGD